MWLWDMFIGLFKDFHYIQCPVCCHHIVYKKEKYTRCWRCDTLSEWEQDGSIHPRLIDIHYRNRNVTVK